MKKSVVFFHDLVVVAASWCLAFLLRFNFSIPEVNALRMLFSLLVVLIVHGLIFWQYGVSRSLWRFVSLPELKRIILAVATATLSTCATLFLVNRLDLVPRSVFVLHPIFSVFFLGGSRLIYRSWKEGHLLSVRQIGSTPVLLLGAGRAASLFLREIAQSKRWRVVGLLDDDVTKLGRLVGGVPVLGLIEDLARVAVARGVGHAIVCMPSAPLSRQRQAAESALEADLTVLTVPSLEDIVGGRVAVSHVRPLELSNLLGRGRVQLDERGLHGFLSGRVVLVTGAGGSIGSELCRQVARFSPAKMILLDICEHSLFQIEEEFSIQSLSVPVIPVVGDVRDKNRIDEILNRFSPEIVFHAAAYKHVPMMENQNCWEAVCNNTLGTLNIARAARGARVKKFVLISTDKAVNPVNVMGASKRLAEMVCLGLQHSGETTFSAVRFGNVIGTTGSVVPKFQAQIARGGPVTVTHPEITRYFMLVTEAAQLVLQAGIMGQGENIFVLDMGAPVRILDMARDMIRLSGFHENDIPVIFTGLRPGEKLHEELLGEREETLPTYHPKVRVVLSPQVSDEWVKNLAVWLEGPRPRTDENVRLEIQRWLPEYVPTPCHAPASLFDPVQGSGFQRKKSIASETVEPKD